MYLYIYIYTFVYRICLNTKHMAISRSRQVAQWHHFWSDSLQVNPLPVKAGGEKRRDGTERGDAEVVMKNPKSCSKASGNDS